MWRGRLCLIWRFVQALALAGALLAPVAPTSHASPGSPSRAEQMTPGAVWTWGSNLSGQLGNGTVPDEIRESASALQVADLRQTIAISAADDYSIALEADGTVWAWGANWGGQLGDGTHEKRDSPVAVSSLTNIVAISTRAFHSLAVRADGTVWGWGFSGLEGQLGIPDDVVIATTAIQVEGLTDVVAVATSPRHSLALKRDGTVWAWGSNSEGQLGSGTACASDECGTVAGQGGRAARDSRHRGGLESLPGSTRRRDSVGLG